MVAQSYFAHIFIAFQAFTNCFCEDVFHRNAFQSEAEKSFNAIGDENLEGINVMGYPNVSRRYLPTWTSLDSRPLPTWYDKSKIGIFITWGVYSVPAVGSEWFWKHWKDGDPEIIRYMDKNYKPGATYQEFAKDFTAEFFDPVKWADLFKKAGAKYIVLVTKHCDGYTLWPSNYSFSWNAMDVGPHRDLVGDLTAAIRNNTNIKLGLYHSFYEWFNPLYLADVKNNLTTNEFIRFKIVPSLYELVETYKPDILWSDGEWDAPDTYWKAQDFVAWLYNDSPVKNNVATNDRWGHDTMCKHGGFYTCADRYNPRFLQSHKWENCFTLDKQSWGYRRNAKLEDYLTPKELITTIVETVACGGNALINVGPSKDGIISPIQEERLLQMGEWLEINGEAIYDSVPYIAQNDSFATGVWYTMSSDKTRVYAMITKWPGSYIVLASVIVKDKTQIWMLGEGHWSLRWKRIAEGIIIKLPLLDQLKSLWVYTLRFTNV